MKTDRLISEFDIKKLDAKAYAEKIEKPELRCEFARSFCGITLDAFWSETCKVNGSSWKITEPFFQFDQLKFDLNSNALALGSILAKLPFPESSYLIGTIYTALLPHDTRSDFGAYYTPPALVDRLIEMVTDEGFDWQNSTVMDLSCGGGAFLSPVALRMVSSLPKKYIKNPKKTIELISRRLKGFEIDPFAAWMSQVLVEIALIKTCIDAKTRLPTIVKICDTLDTLPEKGEEVDLVIGNPPYRKITLPEHQRTLYSRSLYGHANLYGIFTDIGIRWTKPEGHIAYVTPTSFLGGQYFKSLRSMLSQHAPPVTMDFISERKGVFEEVLQETMLVVYKRSSSEKISPDDLRVKVHCLKSNGPEKPVVSESIGSFLLPGGDEDPWFIPKEPNQVLLIENLTKMRNRISHLGYEVNTGQLVWNRHKKQLINEKKNGSYPIIWAESILNDGQFQFNSKRVNHSPFLLLGKNQDFLITKKPCVLVQRTTAKEQKKRIFATVLPKEFISEYGGVVIENHVNIIRQTQISPLISLEALTILLNSNMIDQIFRLISGSVAVSAYELDALPLPKKSDISRLEKLILNGASIGEIELAIRKMYE